MIGDTMAREKKATFVNLDDADRATLDELAAARFAGNRSALIRAALEIAAAVYALPEARAAADPAAALAAYTRAASTR